MPNNVIELVVKATDQATPVLRGVSAAVGGVLRRIGNLNIGRVVLGATAGFAVALRAVIKASSDAQAAQAKLDAAYKSTGATLGLARDALDDLAESIQRTTTFDDDLVKSAQSVLLMFDRVRGQAFERTIRAATDLSAKLGTDLVGATRLLGVALQDPERGMTQLRRSGIILDEQQQKLIKSFVASGQVGKAQAVILKEIEKQAGGTSQALRGTLGGAYEALQNAVGDLFELNKKATAGLTDSLESFIKFLQDPGTKQAIQDFFGLIIAGAENATKILIGLGVIFGVVGDESEKINRAIGRLEELKFLIESRRVFGLLPPGAEEELKRINGLIAELGLRQQAVFGKAGRGALDPGRHPGAAEGVGLSDAQQTALDKWASAIEKINQKYAEQRFLLESIKVGRTADSEAVKEATAALTRLNVAQQQELAELADSLKLEPVLVTAKWDDTLRKWDEETRTVLEGSIAEWRDFSAKIKVQITEGLPKAIADLRLDEKMKQLFPPIEVTVKKIDTKPLQELSAAAKRVAEQIQDAFASAFRSLITGDKPRDIVRNFLLAFAEIPAQLAAQKLGDKIRKAIEPGLEKLLDPGKAARAIADAKLFGDGPTEARTPAQQRAAQIVGDIKQRAAAGVNAAEVRTGTVPVVEAVARQVDTTVSASQSLCECVCSCLSALRESMTGGPDVVVGAIGDQTAAAETAARNASRDVVAGVDTSIRNQTSVLSAKLTEVANFLAPVRDTTASRIFGAIATVLSARASSAEAAGNGSSVVDTAAAGGLVRGGRTLVGEEGPEMVNLPPGSRVTNQRQAAFAAAGAPNLTMANQYSITINGGSDDPESQQQLVGFLQQQDAKQKRWVLDVLRTNFGRVVTP